jgi:hypothetical protein
MIGIENYNPYREECMNLDVIKRLDMMINGGMLPPDYEPLRAGNYNLDILWRMDTIIEMVKNGEFGGGGSEGIYKPTVTNLTASGSIYLKNKSDIINLDISDDGSHIFEIQFPLNYFSEIGIVTIVVTSYNTNQLTVKIPQDYKIIGDKTDIVVPPIILNTPPAPNTPNCIEYSFMTIRTDGVGDHTTLLLSEKYF